MKYVLLPFLKKYFENIFTANPIILGITFNADVI